MPSLQRRGFLAAFASAVAAGCLGSTPGYDPDTADVWPMHRADPGGTNSTDAPGPRTDSEELWSVEIRGLGPQPDPVVHGDRLYHGAFDRFYALDAETGEQRWALSENGSWLQPALAAAPAYGDVMPVVATRSGYEAISTTGGFDTPGRQRNFETRWKRTAVEDEGPVSLGATRAAPPVVADGTLYAATEDAVVAFDAATGTTEWTASVPGANRTRVAVAAGRVFVSSYALEAGGGLVALDAASGEELWTVPDTDVHVLPPTATDDAVFFHDRDVLYALDSTSGNERWTREDFGGIGDSLTPLAVGGGRVVAVGERDRDRDREVVAFDRGSGERLWRVRGGAHEIPPVVAGDTVYVPRDDGLRALDAATGAELWTRGDDFVRSLAVAGRRAYAATATGTLYALEGSA